MRIRYSFSSRKTGHIENIEKQRGKYPDLLQEIIRTSDIILEILDSRFIKETRNLEIEEDIKKLNKKIIYVLNKSDLIDLKIAKKSPELEETKPYVFVSATKRRGGRDLRNKIKMEAKKLRKESNQYNRVQVGVIGYPNSGKSSVINLLTGKPSAGVGRKAGFTKGIQKLRLAENLLLLDSPGVIPNKEYSSIEIKKIEKHAKLNARDWSDVKEPEIIVTKLFQEYPEQFEKYYKIDTKKDAEILIEEYGKKKGFLKKGGLVDTDKTARMILRDWQEGKIKVNL